MKDDVFSEKALVSVIVAAYNAEQYIGECIQSIQKQTYKNWEMWICDDSSTDNTLNVIKALTNNDPRIHILENKERMFAGASRNRCIQASHGEYLMIQDADDVCDKSRINILLNKLQRGIDFISSGYYLFDDEGPYKTCVLKKANPKRKDFLPGMPFCHAASLFNRNIIMAVQGYRVSLLHKEVKIMICLCDSTLQGLRDVIFRIFSMDIESISKRFKGEHSD